MEGLLLLHEIVEGLYFHYSLPVCVNLTVCLGVSEQNVSRADSPILTQFSLNGCIPHWLKAYRNWLKVKVTGA